VIVKIEKMCLYIFLVLMLFCSFCGNVMAANDWALTVYETKLTGDNLTDTFFMQSKYEHSYLVACALSKMIGPFNKNIDVGFEGQVVKHYIGQHHLEFNALIVARWEPFPWDDYLDTSFAMGEGVSYATKTPEIEAKYHAHTSQFLDYMMFELAFAVPKVDHWSVVARIHHRSGAWGLFHGVSGASNSLGFGVRYTF